MKVVCGHCRTGYHIDTSRLSNPFLKVRCSRCQYVFSVYAGDNGNSHATGGGPAALSAPASNRAQLLPDDPFRIIAVSNQKGGVAKTTTCLNLGVSLAMMNKKVLLIDFDTQANLSLCLGYQDYPSFYDLLHRSSGDVNELTLQTRYDNLWLLPSNKNLVLLDKKYFGSVHFENILRDRLLQMTDAYDVILIDTPPSVGFFTLNALTAAHLAVVPCLCEYLSTHGTNQIIEVIRMIQAKTNPLLDFRILVTQYDAADTAAQVIYGKLRENFNGRTFQTVIDYDRKMKEAQIMKLPAIIYDKTCSSGTAYQRLAGELLNSSSMPKEATA